MDGSTVHFLPCQEIPKKQKIQIPKSSTYNYSKKTSLRSSCVRCGVSSSRGIGTYSYGMSLGRRAFIASLLLGWSSAAHLWTNDKISDCAKANREAAVPWLTASTVSVMRILTSPFLRFLPSRNLQPCLSDGIIIFFFLGFLHLHRSAVGRVV